MMRTRQRATASERWLALAYVFGGVIAVGAVGLMPSLVPPCIFRELTGALCPGCGSGRMVGALLRLDLGSALRANPLAFGALLPATYGLARETLSVWGIAELPWPRLGPRWAWCTAAAVGTFWVLRNVPAWPFSLLAPG